MRHKWRILHLAETQYDSAQVLVTLERNGIECDLVHVGTEEDFVAQIERGGFDVILADYSSCSFDDISALNIAQQVCPEVPYIFLPETAGKEFATETLCAGLWSHRN